MSWTREKQDPIGKKVDYGQVILVAISGRTNYLIRTRVRPIRTRVEGRPPWGDLIKTYLIPFFNLISITILLIFFLIYSIVHHCHTFCLFFFGNNFTVGDVFLIWITYIISTTVSSIIILFAASFRIYTVLSSRKE